MAQNEGKKFEEDFKNSIPKGTLYIRLKDPAQSFNMACRACPQNKTRFSLSNPCDIILFTGQELYFLELKSTKGTSFSFQKDKKDKSTSNIKFHQIVDLEKLSDDYVHNVKSGFIFNFRKYDETYFLPIDKFIKFMYNTDKKSINKEDIVKNGGVLIVSDKKRTRFNYNLEDWLND